MYKKYSETDKAIFWARLKKYENALARGTKKEIIHTSIAIYAALGGNVPKWYKREVSRVYNHTHREIPL